MNTYIMKLDYSKIESVEFEDIFHCDAPDYVDAYVSYAEYNGLEMNDKELDELNNNHCDFVQEAVLNHLN